MDWNLIRSFLVVAETGTLIHAGEILNLSQPTLGRHINDLEKNMGLTLFVRSRNGMTLTEAGLTLMEDARQMEKDAERFILKAAGRETKVRGTVRITASEVVATYLLPPILRDLRDQEPKIDIELVSSNQVENLLSRDADIAVRMVQPTQNDLIARKVGDVKMGTYADRDYIAKFGLPREKEDLFKHRLIGYDRNDFILKQMTQMGFTADRNAFAFRTDDQVANWELVKAGAGIGFGGTYIASFTPSLMRVLPQLKLPILPMWLASHQELKTNIRIRRVMDFLYEKLRALPLDRSPANR